MVLGMNILMTVFATLSISFGISYFIREKEIGRIRWFILMLGLMCGATNMGYMLISVNDISMYTFCFRNIGIFGVDLYLYFELLLVLDQIRLNSKIKKTIATVVGTQLAITLALHCNPNDVEFATRNGFTVFTNNHKTGYYLQTLLISVFFITLLCSGLVWLCQQKTKRGRSFVILCFISNFVYVFTSLPYFMGIDLEHPAFLYCLGTMLAFFVMWYAGNRLSGFNVTKQSLGGDIFSWINVSLLVFDTNGNLIMRNEFAKNTMNITLVNRQTLEEIFDITKEEADYAIGRTIKEGEATYKFHKEKEIYAVNLMLKTDVFKEPLCILCVANDVTNEEKMIAQVLKANNAKSDFLASMSHEIRTPINAIIGMNEMIIRESSESDIVNYALDVESSGKMLLSLVNDILDFSKVESGKMEMVPVEYDITSLVNDINNMVFTRAKEKGLEFIIDVDENIPQILYGDEIRIRQIINNLLSNAIKYTDKGSVKLSLKGKVEDDKFYMYISVKDTGKGIKAEDQSRLFDSFTRVDEVENRTIEGTGLGLSLTKSFVEMMGGKLSLESTYGEGSTFTAYIEQRVVNETPIGDFSKKIQEKHIENKNEKNRLRVQKCDVLVVDDVEMNCKVFCGLLKNTGIKIDTALSGEEALSKCKMKKYDIIYMDHRMPVMDGIECLHTLKGMDTLNNETPVVALTANAISGMKEMYLREGFDDYLSKPIDVKYLEKSILKYINVEKETMTEDKDDIVVVDSVNEKNEGLSATFPDINLELGLKYCMGDESFYIDILKEYAKGDRTQLLLECIESNNFKDFKTHIHAIKSTSLNIGAEEVSSKAKTLEEAAGSEDAEYIRNNFEEFLLQYKNLIERIKNL